MTANVKRPRGALARILALATDPSTLALAPQLYALIKAGVKQIMAKDSAGLIYQVTPIFGPNRMSSYYCDDFVSTGLTTFTTAGGGATSLTQVLAGYPGIARSTITSTATPDAVRISVLAASTVIQAMIVGGSSVFFEGCCRTPTVQDGTDQWTDRWGLGDGAVSGNVTDGVYFESDRATNGDNNVRLCAASGGSRTKNSMGVAPTANTFERWKLVVNAAGTSVQGYLNDVAAGSAVASNIPTATATCIIWMQIVKTLGNANARSVDRDYAEVYELFSSPR